MYLIRCDLSALCYRFHDFNVDGRLYSARVIVTTLTGQLWRHRVRLSKRRAKRGVGVQAATNAVLAVKHREMNEQELTAQEMRRMQLEPLEPDDEEEQEEEGEEQEEKMEEEEGEQDAKVRKTNKYFLKIYFDLVHFLQKKHFTFVSNV